MKRCWLIIAAILLVTFGYAQSVSKILVKCEPELVQSFKGDGFNLAMISNEGCGYCQLAMKHLLELSSRENLTINIIDFGSKEKRDRHYSQYYSTYTFIEAGSCLAAKPPKFFPQFVLYDPDGKIVWQKKGWFKENVEDISKKIAKEKGI